MGERATVEYNGVTIYTHWEGDRVKEHIKKAWNAVRGELERCFPAVLLDTMSRRTRDEKMFIGITADKVTEPSEIDIQKQLAFGRSFDDFLIEPYNWPVPGRIGVRLEKEDYIVFHLNDCINANEAAVRIRSALRHRCRWNDAHYLTRIIYDALCGYSFEETGFGISGGTCLHENRHFSINPETRTISWSDYGGKGEKNEPIDEVLEEW